MFKGQYVFSQITDHLPLHTFRRCVERYQGERYVKQFRCFDQYLAMSFAQLTHRESLRDIEACLQAQSSKLYHMGLRSSISRRTLADANEQQDWRIYADFAQALIKIARPLYAGDELGLDLKNTVYELDASTIDLCFSVFPWALFRSTKSAVKLHTLLDLRGNIPSFVHISVGKLHDVNALDMIIPEAGSFYVMDRGYLDFERLFSLNNAGTFFVIRSKNNILFKRRYSQPVDKSNGVQCDQTISLIGLNTKNKYPKPLRRVKYHDNETDKTLNLLNNNEVISPQTVADLYRYRWKVELFFKWIKQHLRIRSFLGTSENAVKSQIWIAITVYVLIAIIKKQLKIKAELYTILQVLSLTLFEKIPLEQLLGNEHYITHIRENAIQLNLLDNLSGH
jgi:hypothetical protein